MPTLELSADSKTADAGQAATIATPGARAAAAQVDRWGALAALSAYLWWGFVPIYFRAVKSASAYELLAHRVVWSCLGLWLLIAFFRRGRDFAALFRDRRTLLTLIASASLIAANWLLYIYAVVSKNVLLGSLAYFINPLISVLLGMVILGERLRRMAQWAAIGLAFTGVVMFASAVGKPPYLSLALAITFGLYGLLRKVVRADALLGLTVETTLLFPLSLGYFVYLFTTSERAFAMGNAQMDILLVLAGPITTIPLLFFAAGARRVSLTTLGLMQYLSPSIQFLVGLAFGESLKPLQWAGFAAIWAGLALFSIDAIRARRVERGNR